MNESMENILDRRRIRRKLTRWRVATFVAVGVALFLLFSALSFPDGRSLTGIKPHIARVPISGFISNNRYALERLEELRKDKNVKGVIVSIDSPGGTTVGGEALHKAIRAIALEKPAVTSVGGLAASAGYMVAVATDHIVAPRSSIIGSIGVVLQYPNAAGLLEKIGIEVNQIKSSPLKAEPTPFSNTPPAARDMLESMLLDTYQWFADLVTERRSLSDEEGIGVLDGSVYTGRQALKRKLIDALGDEASAKQWLIDEKGVDENLEIRTWSLEKPANDFPFIGSLWKVALSNVGLGSLTELATATIPRTAGSHLDGMVSVWQIDSLEPE